MAVTNPDRLPMLPVFDSEKCRRCGACLDVCPRGALFEVSNARCTRCVRYCIAMEVPCAPRYIAIEPDRCDACGRCVAACPHAALAFAPMAHCSG